MTLTKGRRILVVEDDPGLVFLLEEIFASIDPDARLDWIKDGDRAIAEFRANLLRGEDRRYDMIISDNYLDGESSGIDLWRVCQELDPEILFLVISAMSLDKFFGAIGPDVIIPPFLQKPFSVAEGKRVIEGLLAYADHRTMARTGMMGRTG